MIKKRLVSLLADAKKYIGYTVLWQWLALVSQVVAVFTITGVMEELAYGTLTSTRVWRMVPVLGVN